MHRSRFSAPAEVVQFQNLTRDEFVEKLLEASTPESIDQYYDIIVNAGAVPDEERADRGMVAQLVDFLDDDNSGELSKDEIKVLFSRMSGVPVEDIADDHPEVVAFSNITTEELTEKLWVEASKEKIETFHSACGLVWPPPGDGGGATPTAAEVTPESV